MQRKRAKHEGLLKAVALCGNGPPAAINTTPPETIRSQKDHSTTLQAAFESFWNGLLRTTSKKAREYAHQRGLNIELLEIGFNSGQHHHKDKMNEKVVSLM